MLRELTLEEMKQVSGGWTTGYDEDEVIVTARKLDGDMWSISVTPSQLSEMGITLNEFIYGATEAYGLDADTIGYGYGSQPATPSPDPGPIENDETQDQNTSPPPPPPATSLDLLIIQGAGNCGRRAAIDADLYCGLREA